MKVRVIIPPEPLITPADIPGSHASDDVAVAGMIAAVTRTIDGPSGWLSRSLGPQTLELTGYLCGKRFELPYPEVIAIDEVAFEALDGSETLVSVDDYRRRGNDLIFSNALSGAHFYRIRYEAGYDGEPVADGGTGPVPDEVKQALIMSVQHLKSIDVDSLYVRSVEIPDVETKHYTVTDQADGLIRRVTRSLLSGLEIKYL
ncbi:hypothetical protein QBK99_11040 [Corticibacterium sp. UT-5YL-CI-8]|nr:hypothetical protein [Tianweitania sp. UT-5YL-CI-8]